MLGDASFEATIAGLAAAVSTLRVVPNFHPTRHMRVDKSEDGEVRLPTPDASASWSVHIRYVDVAGQESERAISCKRISLGLGGAEVVHAYCHARRQPRCFSIDKIIELYDLSTGEAVDPREHLMQLRAQGLPFANEGMATFAQVCTFMARCDGHDHPLEWEAIERGLERYAIRFGGEDADITASLRKCKVLGPDGMDFTKAINRFQRAAFGPQLAKLTLETCANIVEADGRLSSEEVTWGLYVSDALKKIAMRKD